MKCPKCGARVRIRRPPAPESVAADGFLRFFCPCGRRLKVDAAAPPPAGKCPDCGRVVPVPSASSASVMPPGHPEAPTEDIAPTDRATLERWAAAHHARKAAAPSDREEVGLRVCPACGQPVPMGATACRQCGAAVAVARAPGR